MNHTACMPLVHLPSTRDTLNAISERIDAARRRQHVAEITGDHAEADAAHRDALDAEAERWTLRTHLADDAIFAIRVANHERPDALSATIASVASIARMQSDIVQLAAALVVLEKQIGGEA